MRRIALLALLLPLLALAGPTVNIALEDTDNRPFEYPDGEGGLTGFHIELIRVIGLKLGWSTRFRPLPWGRAESELASGRVDAVSYMAESAARKDYALFLPDNQLHRQRVALYALADKAKQIRYTPPLINMLEKYRIGAGKSYFYNEQINALIKQDKRIDQRALTALQLMEMLRANRYDLVLATADAKQQLSRSRPDLAAQIASLPGVEFGDTPVYLAFGKKGDAPRLAKDFARACAAYRKTTDYRRLLSKYQLPE
ncbi:ABC transporter substrate-binding protein [Chromobacterium sp. IIBBL 290-4]|uniref:substrate-binding periplasmic protein n=1 Tax=Chromobacterium sp. IIBBL 290-4 TaxID=2953890 RepID=UPI0020B8A431|nr:transporter substrate-binding domain-containing protein [Chromobacterium sp. IIBBL 290-4]UTH74488.1 transporter substrate-binding domain-containing protein [Chromobacterium sp. IIBBL 290-4]